MTSSGAGPVRSVLTAYGHVNADALGRLRGGYDTTRLLHAVDALDVLDRELGDPDALRAAMLQLHAMAHTVINDGPVSAASEGMTLPEAATEIEEQLDHMLRTILVVRDLILPLTALGDTDESNSPCTDFDNAG